MQFDACKIKQNLSKQLIDSATGCLLPVEKFIRIDIHTAWTDEIIRNRAISEQNRENSATSLPPPKKNEQNKTVPTTNNRAMKTSTPTQFPVRLDEKQLVQHSTVFI